MEKLWTIVEVARCLDMTEDDVKQLVRQGQLTGYKLGGQFLRFRPDQVEALKGHVTTRLASHASATSAASRSWASRLRDLLYFYDFYLVSGGLLVVLLVYLVVSQ